MLELRLSIVIWIKLAKFNDFIFINVVLGSVQSNLQPTTN